MQKRIIKFVLQAFVLQIVISLFPSLTQANQPEPYVQCIEGQEPLQISYGEHTVDCQIENSTDLDRFQFYGSSGDEIRIMVSRTSGSLHPQLEVWDPNGDKIIDTWSSSDISVDETLAVSGTYLLAISDHGQDYSGSYTLQLEKIPPVFDPPDILYDISTSDNSCYA